MLLPRRDVMHEGPTVMSPPRDRLRPLGPGPESGSASDGARIGAASACPPFDADPIGWLGWLDDALEAGSSLEPAMRPAAWQDGRGCEWRVLASPDGPEVRPGFGGAFMLTRGMPLISALLVTPNRIRVELTWRDGREVVEAGPDEIACRDLGVAMLTGIELPHEAVTRLEPDTWRRAHERWQELLATRDGDDDPASSPSGGAADDHARAPWPLRS